MEYVIKGQEPERLFQIFEEITAIPRASGNEAGIAEYILRFAERLGLEARTDEYHNVVVYKPASAGRENDPPVMLQGHLDMVAETAPGYEHDWLAAGPRIRIDSDGIISAEGTTLGADDGAAVAMMLAVLEDADAVHPPLECVFTVQEETGLTGAKNLDVSWLRSRRMINLDSEEEGILTVSCAGGVRADIFPSETVVTEAEGVLLNVSVNGLKGGHSGSDIQLERGNASRLMGRALWAALNAAPEMRIVSLCGGLKENAITRECRAEILVPCRGCAARVSKALDAVGAEIAAELSRTDPGFSLPHNIVGEAVTGCLSRELTSGLIRFLCLVSYGPVTRDPDMGDFVVTSSNIGIVKADSDGVMITCALRSSVESALEWLKEQMSMLACTLGFEIRFREQYPGWSYDPDSPMRQLVCDCYRDIFGKEMRAEAIHAGLECGLFCLKIPGLDPVAMGPALAHVHTPDEIMDAGSFSRSYRLLTEVLARA